MPIANARRAGQSIKLRTCYVSPDDGSEGAALNYGGSPPLPLLHCGWPLLDDQAMLLRDRQCWQGAVQPLSTATSACRRFFLVPERYPSAPNSRSCSRRRKYVPIAFADLGTAADREGTFSCGRPCDLGDRRYHDVAAKAAAGGTRERHPRGSKTMALQQARQGPLSPVPVVAGRAAAGDGSISAASFSVPNRPCKRANRCGCRTSAVK